MAKGCWWRRGTAQRGRFRKHLALLVQPSSRNPRCRARRLARALWQELTRRAQASFLWLSAGMARNGQSKPPRILQKQKLVSCVEWHVCHWKRAWPWGNTNPRHTKRHCLRRVGTAKNGSLRQCLAQVGKAAVIICLACRVSRRRSAQLQGTRE